MRFAKETETKFDIKSDIFKKTRIRNISPEFSFTKSNKNKEKELENEWILK